MRTTSRASWLLPAFGAVVVVTAKSTNTAASSSAAAAANGPVTAEDYRVKGLDVIEPAFASFDGDMYAGLISIDENEPEEDVTITKERSPNEEGGKLMFWLFEPKAPTVEDSLVVWFNGGPGCSSFDAGLLFEMGPVTTPLRPAGYMDESGTENAPFGFNAYAWTNASAIMYVEQPVGVGYSGGAPAPDTEEDLSRDFYHFMQNFYHLFPSYRAKRLYLVGESYAGMYVPSMAHYIYLENKALEEKSSASSSATTTTTTTGKKNQASSTNQRLINLAGIGVGNGWVDAQIQGPLVIDYAWWHGMIDSVTRDALYVAWEHCEQRTGSEPEPFHPYTVPDECGIMPAVLKAAGAGKFPPLAPNTYDVTTWDNYLVLTSEHGTFAKFYNNPAVKKALNVPESVDKPWMGCLPGAGRRRILTRTTTTRSRSRQLSTAASSSSRTRRHLGPILDNDLPESMSNYVADLLDGAGIDVLIYNGDRDMSTCSQGSEVFLNEMEWSGAQQWLDPHAYQRGLWMVQGEVAGYAKSVQNLEFVVVYNSGHMVPYNQPVNALDLITRLVKGKAHYVDVVIEPIFEPAALPDGKRRSEYYYGHHYVENNNGNAAGHTTLAAVMGFVAGAAAVLFYMLIERNRNYTRQQYDRVMDVET